MRKFSFLNQYIFPKKTKEKVQNVNLKGNVTDLKQKFKGHKHYFPCHVRTPLSATCI